MINKLLLNSFGFTVFSIFGVVLIPAIFFGSNIEEFRYDAVLLTPFLVLAVCILFFGLLMSVVSLKIRGYNSINLKVQKILFVLGVAVFFNDVFVPTQAGELNGVSAQISEPIWMTIFELAILFILIMVVFFGNVKKETYILSSKISLFVLLGVLGMQQYFMYFKNIERQNEGQKSQIIPQSTAKQPNVYLIWLDAMQSDYFLSHVSEKSLEKNYMGFTLFTKNIANYLYSWSSSISFMSGTFNKGETFTDWSEKETFRKALKNKGYELSSYGRDVLLSKLDDNPVGLNEIVKEKWALTHPDMSDFIAYSGVKMLPNFYANEGLLLSQKVGQYWHKKFNSNAKNSNVDTIAKGMHTVGGVYTFERAIEDEHKRAENNQFVMVQALIPHSPNVLSDTCEYVGVSKKNGDQAHKQQVACGTRLLNQFLDELKRLNRYNNSIIAVIGDHGDGRQNIDFKLNSNDKTPFRKQVGKWSENKVLARAHALMMIKPQQSKDNFEVDKDKRTQLVDLVPTLYGLLNWTNEAEMDGQNVFSEKFKSIIPKIVYFKSPYFKNKADAEVFEVREKGMPGDMKLDFVGSEAEYFSVD